MTNSKEKKPSLETRKAFYEAERALDEREAKIRVLRNVRWSSRWTWRQMQEIKDAVNELKLRVVMTTSHCSYEPGSILYESYPFSDPKSLSTYDGCHDFEINYACEDCCVPDVSVKVTIWDGENLRGERTAPRVTYYLVGEWQSVKWLREVVDSAFAQHCLDAYDAELERQRQFGAQALGASLVQAIVGPRKSIY